MALAFVLWALNRTARDIPDMPDTTMRYLTVVSDMTVSYLAVMYG